MLLVYLLLYLMAVAVLLAFFYGAGKLNDEYDKFNK